MEYFKQTLKTDFEDLLKRFQATESVRFEEFSSIWREMKVSTIFYGILEPNTKTAFSRLALSVACPYLFPPYSFQIRVGGLYLVYSLYNIQLSIPKEQIHIALKDWDDLMHFRQDALEAQHYDVVFILRKLQQEKAFYFTAMPETLFFQVKKKIANRKQQLCESFLDHPSRPQELISNNFLEELVNVHEHYEGLKNLVLPQSPPSDMSLIKQNLVPKMHSAILTFSSWQKNQDESLLVKDAGEGTSSQEESSNRAELLASIKSKSYAQAYEASKSRRHRQIEVMSAALFAQPKFKRPQSLKSRTSSRFMSQGSQNKELQRATMLWRLCTLEGEKTEGKKKRRFIWKELMRSKQ